MAPPRAWNLTVDSYCTPSIGSYVVDVEIVQGYILDRREDCIVSTSKDDKLILEESSRVLSSSNRTATRWIETLNSELKLRLLCSLVLSCLLVDELVVVLEIGRDPEEIVCLLVIFVQSTKQEHSLLDNSWLSNQLLQ